MKKPGTFKKRQSGFTLVELMVVISIISILVAIMVPNLVSMIQRAQNADIANSGHKLQQFLETYSIEAEQQGIRSYPVTPSEIVSKSFFLDHKMGNPYYTGSDSSVISDNGQGTVKYGAVSAGQWIIYIPNSKVLYDATIGASVVTESGQGKGMIVLFPYTSGDQSYPAAATDQVGGYQIRGVDSTGRYIRGFAINGGENYIDP